MPWPSETLRDTTTFDLLEAERVRQTTGLQLIASENFASPDVMAATGSVLTNKYSEGYPTKRYYGGNAVVDDVEALAIERVKNCLVQITPMCNHTRARVQTWLFILGC